MSAPAELPLISSFKYGVVCALPKERLAVVASFDTKFEGMHPKAVNDTNVYTLGRIDGVPVVVCSLPVGEYGQVTAAAAASHFERTYTDLEYVFFVGIAGASPTVADLRLGDVVTSAQGVKQFDLGKETDAGFECTGEVVRPSRYFNGLVAKLIEELSLANADIVNQKLQVHLNHIYAALAPKLRAQYARPLTETDVLFPADFPHVKEPIDAACNPHCMSAREPIKRAVRDDKNFEIFQGLIGSSDKLMKNAAKRDAIAKKHGIICFEMESAGITGMKAEIMTIRGLCDYSDSHKNKKWQEYSCATAAAVFKHVFVMAVNHTAAQPAVSASTPPGVARSSTSSSAPDGPPRVDCVFNLDENLICVGGQTAILLGLEETIASLRDDPHCMVRVQIDKYGAAKSRLAELKSSGITTDADREEASSLRHVMERYDVFGKHLDDLLAEMVTVFVRNFSKWIGFLTKEEFARSIQALFQCRFKSGLIEESLTKFDVFHHVTNPEQDVGFGVYLSQDQCNELEQRTVPLRFLTSSYGLDWFDLPREVMVNQGMPVMVWEYFRLKYATKKTPPSESDYFGGRWKVGLG